MHTKTMAILVILVPGQAGVLAQESPRDRLEGWTGGPYKVAATDFTGDGRIDVMLAYHLIGVVSVLQGDGYGRLSPLAVNDVSDHTMKPGDESWSDPHVHNLAHEDVDGDGLPDLIVAVGGLSKVKTGRIVISRNQGKGRFRPMLEYRVPSQAKGVRFADMDGDGRLDVLYTARGSGYENDLKRGLLYIRRGLGDWKFGPAVESDAGKSAYFVETADLNNDGFLDVIVPNEHDSCATYFINPGKSLFTAGKPLSGRIARAAQLPGRRSHAVNDVRAADLNGDGNLDLLTANLGTSTISFFAGKGDGTFHKDVPFEAGKNGAFLEIGDFDSDGDRDFVITHWTEDFASVFLNNGNGTFAPRVDYKTGLGNYGVDVADVDNDGHLDIVTANYRARSMSLLIGIGDGSFTTAVTSSQSLRRTNGKWTREDR